LFVEGKPVVSSGRLANQEEGMIVERVNERVKRLMS